jgi:predicted TIM-barrel fold metal-dependent hydrolase
MLHFPKTKFALAHISWPWTDECIAVAGRMRYAFQRGEVPQMQMYIDITRGTPEFYRTEALDRALRYLGPERLMFGSDDFVPGEFATSRRDLDADRNIICNELAYCEKDFLRITRDNVEEFLRPFD